MTMFRRELKNNVKNEIIRDEQNYKSLAKSIEIVIDFNNKLYKQVMKKQYNLFKDKTELIYESVADYAKSKQQLYIKNSKCIEFALIELNMTHRRKRKNSKNKKESKERKLCY